MTTPKLPKLPKGWSWKKAYGGKLIELRKGGVTVGTADYFWHEGEWSVYRRCSKTGMFLSIPVSQHEDGDEAIDALLDLFRKTPKGGN